MIDWKNTKVVVTGAAGFIGSHLVERLLELGADVTAFVRYNSNNSAGRLEYIDESKRARLRIVSGDIGELETMRGVLAGQDVVFHLAALVSIPYSYVHPNEVVEVNTIGTLNVLTAAKENKLRKILVTSTSEVYGTAVTAPIDESHPKQPQSPYSASKIAADAVALSFHHAFDSPVVVVRPFNTYGPRQSDRAIIPTIISQALTRREIVIGNTRPTRDFTYVTDTVEGMLRAADCDKCIGQEINLGAGQEISIGDLAERIRRMVGSDVTIRQSDERLRPAKSEVERLLSSNAKMRSLTGWEPHVSLDEGLRRTMDWIRQHTELFDPVQYRIYGARAMKAVVLVGGLGTRLRPLTFSIPKPLLPVGERPIVQLIIEQLRDAGIREIVLATGYQAELIHAFCGDGSKFGVTISYVHEDTPLGTAGPLALVRDSVQAGEHVVLMNGDILTKLDFADFADRARRRDWDLTVGYTTHVYTSPFGVLSIDDELVTGVVEKPTQTYPISAGIYCVKSTALAHVPRDTFFTVPDLIHELLAARKTVGTYHIAEAWIGLESISHFEDALKELGNAPVPDAATRPAPPTR